MFFFTRNFSLKIDDDRNILVASRKRVQDEAERYYCVEWSRMWT